MSEPQVTATRNGNPTSTPKTRDRMEGYACFYQQAWKTAHDKMCTVIMFHPMTSATATATGCHWIEEYKKSKKRKEKREKMSLQYVLMHKIKHSNPLNHTKIKCKKKRRRKKSPLLPQTSNSSGNNKF